MIENNELANIEKRIVTRFLDMFIKFGLILALASFCFTVFSPFLNMMLWALILAVTLYPLHQHIARRIGGRQGLASTILVLFGLLIIVIPTIFMVTSLGSAGSLIDKVSGSDLTLPPPSANVASIPSSAVSCMRSG